MPIRLTYIVAVALSVASPSSAQVSDPDASEAAARVALAVLGVAATPNDTLSSFSILSASGDATSLRSSQLRGGTNPFDDNIFVEGLIAYQRYNPTLIFPEIAPDTELDVTWASVSGTVGVGWDFPLTGSWKIRPTAHVSLGRVTTDAFLVDLPVLPSGQRAEEAVDGNLNAFGLGGSLSIHRDKDIGRWQSEWRFRQTYLEFHPINEPEAGNATADSNQTTVFSRHRYQLENIELFNLSTKLVLDAGVVLYHGDGAAVLGTDWVATAGVGLELLTDETGLPVVSAGRVMLNGVTSETFEGISIGFGLSF